MNTREDIAIKVSNLSKVFHSYDKPTYRLLELFKPYLLKVSSKFDKQYSKDFWALKEISFEVKKGEAFGIIGRNGAGKSTLLQIIAGTLTPTTGSIEVNGRVNALLELGSGFNPDFTGRENVFMNGAILGFSQEFIRSKFQEILEFSEIGDFIDQPVKTYSSGMFVRLAFSVQALMEPEILIIDEALAVGDIFFVQKCHAKIDELLSRGNTTFLFVTHDTGAIQKYCDRVLLLHKGVCHSIGEPNITVTKYYYLESEEAGLVSSPKVLKPKNLSSDLNDNFIQSRINYWPPLDFSFNLKSAVTTGEEKSATLVYLSILNENNERQNNFQIGEYINFYYEFDLKREFMSLEGNITLFDSKNIPIHLKSSLHYQIDVPAVVSPDSKIRFKQRIKLDLGVGEYTFHIALGNINSEIYGRVDKIPNSQLMDEWKSIISVGNLGSFSVIPKQMGIQIPFMGSVDLPGSMEIEYLPFKSIN